MAAGRATRPSGSRTRAARRGRERTAVRAGCGIPGCDWHNTGKKCGYRDGAGFDWLAGGWHDRDGVCERIADAGDRSGRLGAAGGGACRDGEQWGAAMIPVPSGVQVWLATGHTDMRKGFDGLALLVQETLKRNPHNGHLFVFRGRRGALVKVLWTAGQGMCLFAKRLERGRFIWPSTNPGDDADRSVTITSAQLGYLLEGIDWGPPAQTGR